MEKKEILKYDFNVIAPFNSRMIFDYSTLIGKYEKIRKLLYLRLDAIYPNHIVIEKLKGESSDSLKKWAKEKEKSIHEEEEEDQLLFTGTGGSGVTQRDKSIITIQVDKQYNLPLDIIGTGVFSNPPILQFETMTFHEYGIGTIYCSLDARFKQDIFIIEQMEPKKIMADLLDKIIRFPDFMRDSESISKTVFRISKEIVEELEIRKPIIKYDDLFSNQKSDIPLWGHMVLIRNKLRDENKIPINDIMRNVIEVSHPEGAINFTKNSESFVHIGWGNSLWAGLNDQELSYTKEVLRYLEIEWRTLQVFNEILYRRLNQLASYTGIQKRRIRKSVRWINKLRMELELYSVNKSNYLQNLAPFAHFIYQASSESWRNSQMEEFFMDKLDVFTYLHKRGKEKLQEINDNKMNNILFIFTCISLVSTFIDGIMFVFAEHIAETFIFRLFLVIFPPIAFIVLIVLIIQRIIGFKE